MRRLNMICEGGLIGQLVAVVHGTKRGDGKPRYEEMRWTLVRTEASAAGR